MRRIVAAIREGRRATAPGRSAKGSAGTTACNLPHAIPDGADESEVGSSGVPTSALTAKQLFRFVAHQPILDVEGQVFGYELLFRDGVENLFQSPDLEAAARSMLDSTLRLGFDVLCDGQRAIINWTHDRPLKDGI